MHLRLRRFLHDQEDRFVVFAVAVGSGNIQEPRRIGEEARRSFALHLRAQKRVVVNPGQRAPVGPIFAR